MNVPGKQPSSPSGGQEELFKLQVIPDCGTAITLICEMSRLKTTVYAVKYYALVGRPINDQTMTWHRIENFKTLQTIIKNHKDPSEEYL